MVLGEGENFFSREKRFFLSKDSTLSEIISPYREQSLLKKDGGRLPPPLSRQREGDFFGGKVTPFAAGEISEQEGTDGNAAEAFDAGAAEGCHAADLAVTAFVEGKFIKFVADFPDGIGFENFALIGDSLQKGFDLTRGQFFIQTDVITFADIERGVTESIDVFSVI